MWSALSNTTSMMTVNRGLERGLNKKMGRRALRGKTNSKKGPRNFAKGRGARLMGKVSSKGKFTYRSFRTPVFMVPDLTDCELKPYVAYGTPKVKVPPPEVPKLTLDDIEVDILDIVAPQHKLKRSIEAQISAQFGEFDTEGEGEGEVFGEKEDVEVEYLR
eukprot:TRINITY_DN4719_c0_g1_i1.p1 TRINITY_DN4719_c0_g1~~TRINITY_DN4719_c0_g1_i1.p1  ORF type:complete len:161 (-),score=44.29 TRINITY_DN4719_c0_g1_i1:253-735(-)